MPKKPELTEGDAEARRAFGDGVRRLRDQLGKTPAEVAELTGISLAHQYRIEAGERTADVLYLLKLTNAYGSVAANVLLDLRNSSPPLPGAMSNSGDGVVQIGSVGGRVSIRKTGR